MWLARAVVAPIPTSAGRVVFGSAAGAASSFPRRPGRSSRTSPTSLSTLPAPLPARRAHRRQHAHLAGGWSSASTPRSATPAATTEYEFSRPLRREFGSPGEYGLEGKRSMELARVKGSPARGSARSAEVDMAGASASIGGGWGLVPGAATPSGTPGLIEIEARGGGGCLPR